MPVHVLRHPLAAHLITHLRDKTTRPATFRTLAYHLSTLLVIESTADVETEFKEIETPLERMRGSVLARQPLVVVPILRAGLGMVQPFTDLFPDVAVGYVGLERDHATAKPRSYYCKLPPLAGRHVFIVDPMLATEPAMPKHLREEAYQWLALLPGFRGKEKALRKEFERHLERKVERNLL